MSKFYFLNRSYQPNTASSNRALAYLKGISELGVDTHAVFFMTDEQNSKIEGPMAHIHTKYYWDFPFYINKHGWRSLFYVLHVLLFIVNLKKGDIVYLYDMPDVLHFVLKKKGIKVYHEITEHPEVISLGTGLYVPSIDTYLNDCRHLDGLIVISTELKQYFVEKGVPEKNITIINVIVDAARFQGINKMKNVEPYIAYCGAASNKKDGVDKLIKAFDSVHKKHPEMKLYVIGKTPSLGEAFENQRLVDDLQLKEAVVFTGIVPAAEMPQMLVNAVAVALARPDNLQARYGFPTKSGEYLLSGTPAVFTAVGDIPKLFTHKHDSLIVPPEDNQALAEALNWIIEHPIEAAKIGENGKETALREFNYIVETKKLINLIMPHERV